MKKLLFFLWMSAQIWSMQAQGSADYRTIQNGFGPAREIERSTTEITPNQIEFWVGQGSNEMIVIFYWCQDSPIGLAYGYRWDGIKNIENMLSEIDAADTRLGIVVTSWISSYSYSDSIYNLYIASDGMLSYTLNGEWAGGLSDQLTDGDLFEIVEYGNCSTPTNVVPVSNPNGVQLPDDVTIPLNQITYWVGSGDHEVIFAVNWCDPAIAFAWGVRFYGDSILVSDVMNSLAIYDSRISFTYGSFGLTEIAYQDGTYNLSLSGGWWMYNVNGQTALLGIDAQYVHHGNIIKWGDESCGTADENYNYVWITPIQPIGTSESSADYFDGIVGSDPYIAVHCEDPSILAWATGCDVIRGYQNIASPTMLASYGNEQNAIGAATASTTDVISLGDNGSAILTFNTPISNGIGYDFAIFENSLNDIFLELAFVEVSSDGIHYFRFPATSNTPISSQITNSGSVDARHIQNLAGKHRAGWGTPFDLEELSGYTNLDINHITHIKIIDVVGSINPLHGSFDKHGKIINDPYPTDFASGGFDLSGVAVLNGWTPSAISDYDQSILINIYPNPCTEFVTIENQELKNGSLYNAFGQLLQSFTIEYSSYRIDMQQYASGIYFIQIDQQMVKIVKK